MLQIACVAAAVRSYLTSRTNSIIAIAIIVLVATAIWFWAAPYNFILCYTDCGETFISHNFAKLFNQFGLKFGLMEDHATSPSISAHPFLYTHNVNLGGLTFVLYEAMGLTSIAAKQFMVLLTFCASLFLIYRTALYYSRSTVTAFIVLLVAATDVGSFVVFSLSAARVWAWVALSGILLFSGRLSEGHGPRSTNIAGLLFFDCIAFATGYGFWIICSVVSVFIVVAFALKDFRTKRFLSLITIACIVAIVPFLLRQIHVAAVMGGEYWVKDFYYSFTIKIPLMGLFISLPTLPEIAEFYRANHVMQWRGAVPDQSIMDYVNQFGIAYYVFSTVMLPNIGLLTFVVSYCLVIAPAILMLRPNKVPSGHGFDEKVTTPERQQQIERPLRLYLSLIAGLVFGSLAIIKMVIPFYLSRHMPLFGIVFVFVKGFFLGMLVQWAVQFKPRVKPWGRVIACLMITWIVIDHVVIQVSTAQSMKPMETRWIDAVKATPNATYAVSTIPPTVAAFTKNWVVGVDPWKAHTYFERLANGQAPFKKEDLIRLGERDAESLNWPYLRPDFWLYFPDDQEAAYFSHEKACRKDYLHRAFSKLSSQWRPPIAVFSPLLASSISPGGRLPLSAHIVNFDSVRAVRIMIDGKFAGSLRMNCLLRSASGTIEIPRNTRIGDVEIVARIDGSTEAASKTITVGAIRVVPGAIQAPSPFIKKQLRVPEVLAKYPQLDVVKVHAPDKSGTGYLIIRLPKAEPAASSSTGTGR